MRVIGKIILLFSLVCGSLILFSSQVMAVPIPPEGLKVGTTYYGGHFDASLNSWVVDNANQCSRIKSGEISLESLSAIMSKNCNDDNGLGYIGSIPLHNQVSFAELSTDYKNPDYGSLGKLPAGSKLLIQYNDRCLIAEKRDVGQGGEPVYGFHRSLDLWWQTARSIGFTNGYDVMTIKKVSDETPLSTLGTSFVCASNTVVNSAPGQENSTLLNAESSNEEVNPQTTLNKKPTLDKNPVKKIEPDDTTASEQNENSVLGSSYTVPLQQDSRNNTLLDVAFIVIALATLAGVPIYALIKHPLV